MKQTRFISCDKCLFTLQPNVPQEIDLTEAQLLHQAVVFIRDVSLNGYVEPDSQRLYYREPKCQRWPLYYTFHALIPFEYDLSLQNVLVERKMSFHFVEMKVGNVTRQQIMETPTCNTR